MKNLLLATVINLAVSAMAWNNLPDVNCREFWDKQKQNPAYPFLVARAAAMRAEKWEDPTPWYDDFFKTGNRSNYQDRYYGFAFFGELVFEYCINRTPESLVEIEKRLEMLIAMKTWVVPAHDFGKVNFLGQDVTIDLASSGLGHNCAITLSLLRPVLKKDLAARLEKELYRRIIEPTEAIIEGRHEVWPWMRKDNNWIAICNEGIIGTALRLDMPDARRRKIIDYLVKLNSNYIGGMGDEGYCSEGVSYWTYGFGRYLAMTMMLRQYDGRDILFKYPGMVKMAQYSELCSFSGDFYPSYSDAPIEVKDDLFILELRDIALNRRKGFSGKYSFEMLKQLGVMNYWTLYFSLYSGEALIDRDKVEREFLTSFPKAGVYVARGGAKCAMSVSFKGGSNHEMHNHNDVGSYVVALGKTAVILDPGKEVYTRRTFSMERYTSKLLNSYGHSVPVIDGKLQASPMERMDTDAVLLEEKSSADTVRAVFDIRAPYKHIPGIVKLNRTFEFDRKLSGGVFKVTDSAEFSRKMSFENAVITFGEVKALGGGRYLVTEKGKTVLLTVVSSAPYEFSVADINENTTHKRTVHRLTFVCKEKVDKVEMSFTFTEYK